MSASDMSRSSPPPLRPTPVFALQALLFAVAALTLLDQLRRMDMAALLRSLPDSMLFYLLFVVVYLLLPATDALIHSRFWGTPFRRLLPAMMRKRVYNFAAFGYSGEAYVLGWARTKLNLPWRQAFSLIKDSAVLSALASNLAAVCAIAMVLLDPRMVAIVVALGVPEGALWAAAGLGLALLVAPLVWRRRILALSTAACLEVLALHSVRLIAVLVGQVAIWAFLAPAVPLQVWLVLTTIYLVVSRVPWLPNRDLVFAAAALALAGGFGAEADAIRSAVLVSAALTQIAHAASFLLTVPLESISGGRIGEACSDAARRRGRRSVN